MSAPAVSPVAVPFAPPDLGPDEFAEVQRMLEPGWLSTGPRVRQFEQAFAGRGALRAAMAIARLTEGR